MHALAGIKPRIQRPCRGCGPFGASDHGGNCNAKECMTLPVSSRVFKGRVEGVGHSALLTGLIVSTIHGSICRLAASARRAKALGAPRTPSCTVVFPHPTVSKINSA